MTELLRRPSRPGPRRAPRLAAACGCACAAAALARPAPAAADPAPLATARADVDGDGAADGIAVYPGGRLAVARAAGGDVTAELGAGLARAELTVAGPAGHVVIAATIVRDGGGREGVALAWDAAARRLGVVWRGPVGPVGEDGEYSIGIAATADGLVRFQRRPGVVRCDGEPARLYAEAWDPARRRFRPIAASVGVPAAAPVVKASATAPAAAPARSLVFRATAASTEAGAGDAGGLAAPRALDDGDPATAWREDLAGDGRGEFFTFRAALSGARAVGLRIVPGDAASAAARAAHNRVARLAVVGGGRAYWIDVPDGKGAPDAPLWAIFPEPIAAPCVTVVLAGFHRGRGAAAGGGDSAIAELSVLADTDVAPGGADAALAAAVAAGGTDAIAARRILAGRGAGAAKALADLLATATDDATRGRLLDALTANGDPAAAPALGRALAAGALRGPDAERTAAALVASGAAGQAQVAAVARSQTASDEVKVAAVRALGDGDGAAIDALVALAGERPARAVRAAVIDALARRPVADLVARAKAAHVADVWWAAARSAAGASARPGAARDPAAIAALRAAMRAELATLGAAPTAADYELRYRLIAALARLGDGGDVDAVVRALAALPAGDAAAATRAALRQVAAAAFFYNPAPEAAHALVGLSGDDDPGVRLAAIAALAGRGDEAGGGGGAWTSGAPAALRDAIDRAIGTALARDHWPEVRSSAAAALGARCRRPGPARALGAAVDGDADDGVRGDALAALVTCGAPGVGDRLIRVADDAHRSVELRARAVDLAVALGDRALAGPLEARFQRWRGAAFSDAASLQLAAHAAVALGRLGDRGAERLLLDAAADAAFPELQAAAASALGQLRPCSAQVRQALADLTTSGERRVQLAARRARAMCGR